ncbi:glycoside hydrolase family 88 protein [Paenibacillus foliorum]|nr:glycoside hydrolase family 88 protein [Paenibacillus foliorum]
MELPWRRLYLFADAVDAPGLHFPGLQIPSGFQAVAVVPAPDELARLQIPGTGPATRFFFAGATPREPVRVQTLRITFASNIKGEVEVEAFLPESKRRIGLFDVRYAYSKQMFEIAVDPGMVDGIYREGIGLRLTKGTEAVWILWGEGKDCSVFAPHLLVLPETEDFTSKNRLALFNHHLKSQVCYHRSGWMEGCVLDGLYDLYRQTEDITYLHAVKNHLQQFLADNSGSEEHSGPRVQNGKIVADVTERTLPYAVLARIEPDHPAIGALIEHWYADKREDGSVYDRETDTITGEGVYTAGYPMAAIAAALDRDDLAELALRQLLSRKERLAAEAGIYLRADVQGQRTYLNWARAWAWYLLGAARILIELKDWSLKSPNLYYEEAAKEFVRAAVIAASMQQEDGLWAVFTDDPVTGAEAGGSAGIAAALALGVRYGFLEEAFRSKAETAWDGLLLHLTPDGLLGGVSQTNQGGEELQRSGYRVLFQMGMGLMAQLGAALGKSL